MQNEEWDYLLKKFRRLGGTAENIELQEGKNGRGVFSINPDERSKIITPKNILIKRSDIQLLNNTISIKANSETANAEQEFIEHYYNELSWGNGGRSESQSFLSQIASMPISIKNDLAKYRFIDSRILEYQNNMDTLLERFIDERAFQFRGESVLAPMLELVNHSNYAPPFRATKAGLETPPINPTNSELLHKYSGKNSPMSLWRSYGFASKSIATYSIPFEVSINQLSFTLRCFGQQEAGTERTNIGNSDSRILSIDSFPAGCQSHTLPLSYLISVISPMGANMGANFDIAKNLMIFIQNINIQAREKLLDTIQTQEKFQAPELCIALRHEIEMIQTSLVATELSQP